MNNSGAEGFDKAEILEVIEADLNSYLARDKTAWCENWAQDARMTSIMECGSLQVARGFSEFRKNVFLAMDTSPTPTAPDISRENLSVYICGDLAWAVFDQRVGDTEDPVAPPNFSHNFRLLENVQGKWKIVFHGVWSRPVPSVSQPTIEVDTEGRVQWLNSAAQARLRSFSGLAVSAGRLRASRPQWDKKLQSTIKRSAELLNYAAFNKESGRADKALVYPVVLGEDEAGSALLCFVRIMDARIYVSFGKHPTLNAQIEIAGLIYGLSEAQIELAGLIADGADLAEAASAMEVSVNTVRTHLRRMFDKTDVRSQIDLLRLFLSLG